MTKNQIDYAKLREEQRHNIIQEKLTDREVGAKELTAATGFGTLNENVRHNLATEYYSYANLDELRRHNVNLESVNWYEAESDRQYKQKTAETGYLNAQTQSAAQLETVRHNQAVESETNRHNYVLEDEQIRHQNAEDTRLDAKNQAEISKIEAEASRARSESDKANAWISLETARTNAQIDRWENQNMTDIVDSSSGMVRSATGFVSGLDSIPY